MGNNCCLSETKEPDYKSPLNPASPLIPTHHSPMINKQSTMSSNRKRKTAAAAAHAHMRQPTAGDRKALEHFIKEFGVKSVIYKQERSFFESYICENLPHSGRNHNSNLSLRSHTDHESQTGVDSARAIESKRLV